MSKAYDNAKELDYINFDSANNRINFGVSIASNNTLVADLSSGVYANGAFIQANAAYSAANNVVPLVQPAYNHANAAFNYANTRLSSSGGLLDGSLNITGNLSVAGYTTTVSANNLSIKDNMIYLNSDSNTANPDLGFAGNYNDGVYQHAGLFRDASDGIWKFFEGYTPEPDASPFIDTTHASFKIANLTANIVSNSVSIQGTNVFDQLSRANSAFLHANAAFSSANGKLSSSGGTISGSLTVTGTVTDSKGESRTLPNNGQSGSYTLVSSDHGKLINTTAGVTVPSGVFNTGESITVFNNSGSAITITQGASVTMYFVGSASTGNRTLAQRGLCTIVCVGSNTFVITGGGLT